MGMFDSYPDYGTMTSGRSGPLSRLEADISGTYGEGDLGEQGYTATIDGDKVTYFKNGVETDPPDEIKEAFMSADDEDISAFGDAGGPTFDPEKAIKELGKMGKPTKQGPLFSEAPPKGQLPLSMQGRVGLGSGYRETQNPYETPSYLMSSAQYNQQISQLLGGLLSRSIRNNPIKYLV